MPSSTQTDPREEVLKLAFMEGAKWPLDPAPLRALIAMGMPYAQIAKHFAVNRIDVCDLRARYGIARPVQPVFNNINKEP